MQTVSWLLKRNWRPTDYDKTRKIIQNKKRQKQRKIRLIRRKFKRRRKEERK